jgi:H+/gluconate symporter-like permease
MNYYLRWARNFGIVILALAAIAGLVTAAVKNDIAFWVIQGTMLLAMITALTRPRRTKP